VEEGLEVMYITLLMKRKGSVSMVYRLESGVLDVQKGLIVGTRGWAVPVLIRRRKR
jgi:hypothetical protein